MSRPRAAEPVSVPARLLFLAIALTSAATAASYAGRWSWLCELLVNFRTHYALLFLVGAVLALALRRWRLAAVAVSGLALNAWPMTDVFHGADGPPPPGATPVRLVAFNLYIGNDDMAAVAAYLESLRPDVVVLEEISPANADRLHERLPALPHAYLEANEGIGGVVILSRWPLREPRMLRHEGRPLVARVEVDLGDRRLTVFGAHLHWPLVPAAARIRNQQLAALGPELARCAGACVIVGDFNTTPWSSHLRDLRAASGFRDCARGRGWLPTWRSGLPAPLRIRIDHCLVGGPVTVSNVQVGDSVGSDHFATINDLNVAAGTFSGP